ncbi:hypothetical protein ACGF3G_30040 [Streptomyces sp. NPDC048179]|uniref:hypothetical protein n=1 Tax=Streptomyces sp. NPDC048179 TaxID=3365506 RepID=UPI00371BE747
MPADATSPKKPRENRAALTHRTGYALRHPDRVGHYRAVMASDTRRGPEVAVGSRTHDRRPALGRMRFDHLVEHGLRPDHRMLDMTITGDLTLDFLPDDRVDVVHAHSVFSPSPPEVIERRLAHVGRVLREDFYHRAEILLALARRHGPHARSMADREKRPHGRSKIRVGRSPLPTA